MNASLHSEVEAEIGRARRKAERMLSGIEVIHNSKSDDKIPYACDAMLGAMMAIAHDMAGIRCTMTHVPDPSLVKAWPNSTTFLRTAHRNASGVQRRVYVGGETMIHSPWRDCGDPIEGPLLMDILAALHLMTSRTRAVSRDHLHLLASAQKHLGGRGEVVAPFPWKMPMTQTTIHPDLQHLVGPTLSVSIWSGEDPMEIWIGQGRGHDRSPSLLDVMRILSQAKAPEAIRGTGRCDRTPSPE